MYKMVVFKTKELLKNWIYKTQTPDNGNILTWPSVNRPIHSVIYFWAGEPNNTMVYADFLLK